MALTAMAHITKRELVILLIKELMKHLFSLSLVYLCTLVHLYAHNILLHASSPCVLYIYFSCQTLTGSVIDTVIKVVNLKTMPVEHYGDDTLLTFYDTSLFLYYWYISANLIFLTL